MVFISLIYLLNFCHKQLATFISAKQTFVTDQEVVHGYSPIADMESNEGQVNETRQAKEAGISGYILQVIF